MTGKFKSLQQRKPWQELVVPAIKGAIAGGIATWAVGMLFGASYEIAGYMALAGSCGGIVLFVALVYGMPEGRVESTQDGPCVEIAEGVTLTLVTSERGLLVEVSGFSNGNRIFLGGRMGRKMAEDLVDLLVDQSMRQDVLFPEWGVA